MIKTSWNKYNAVISQHTAKKEDKLLELLKSKAEDPDPDLLRGLFSQAKSLIDTSVHFFNDPALTRKFKKLETLIQVEKLDSALKLYEKEIMPIIDLWDKKNK